MSGVRAPAPTLVLAAIVFVFYLATLAPSLNWADGARMQLDVMFGGSTYWSFDEAQLAQTDGLPFDRLGVAAWDHPLYIMLGQLFRALPLGEPLYRINLMSAVFGALGIAIAYEIGLLLVKDSFMAALGSLALAVSHTYWFHSVTSEAYTLHIAFMALAVWIALRWPIYHRWRELSALALISGLGMANHIMLGLTLVVVALYIASTSTAAPGQGFGLKSILSLRSYLAFLRELGARRAGGFVLLFIVGFAPWWVQFIRMARVIGVPLTLQLAAGFPWLGHRFGATSWENVFTNLLTFGGWLVFQFSPIGTAIGLYGLWRLRRMQPDQARFVLALIAVHVAFSANYRLADQFNFHLPSYFAFTLAIICGLSQIWKSLSTRLHSGQTWPKLSLQAAAIIIVLLPVGIYVLTPATLRAAGLTEGRLGVPPVGIGARDAFSYFLDPNSHGDDSAARFARSTLAQLAPDALVFTPKPSDQETYVVLRYVQLIEKVRSDVHLELVLFDPVDDVAEAILEQAHLQQACRPLYLASLNPKTYPIVAFEKEFVILPQANLYRLLPRENLAPPMVCPDPAARWAGVSFNQLIHLSMRRE